MVRIIHLIMICFIQSAMIAQQTGVANITSDTMTLPAAEIKATTAFLSGNTVVLRWAPARPDVWRYSAFYGYKIERAEFDTLSGKNPEWVTIADRLKPLTLEAWRELVKKSPDDIYLQAAGQAQHGERNASPLTMENMFRKSDELNNYYAAAMLSAEFSAQAGLASALRYEDRNVLRDKVYTYRITSLCPTQTLDISPGLTSVSTYEVREFPKVLIQRVYEGEKYVELYWDKALHNIHYSAFNVYRAPEGSENFVKLNIVPVSYTAYKNDQEYIYRDSLTENYKKYRYKVEGLTSFATHGPLSDPVTAMGRDRTSPNAPYNVKADYKGGGIMHLSWEVNPADDDIAGFRISRSNKIDGGYVELTTEPLSPRTRTYVDSTCNELIHNYYFIGVFDHEGNVNVAMPVYGTIIDSVPPAPPAGLSGSIDTNGVVTLTWRLGDEPDLRGYYIHYSDSNQHTFKNITGYPLQDTVWRDTIPLNVLTEEIYYKIVAIDHRSNYSGYSEMLTLKKPDKVPPVAPVFTGSYNDKGRVELSWYNSSSHDVVANVLERKSENDRAFREIYRVNSMEAIGKYSDTQVVPGLEYEYRLYALDDAGLRSEYAGKVVITAFESKTLPEPKNLNIRVDTLKKEVQLSWDYPIEGDIRFVVYRSADSLSMVSHKVLKNVTTFKDFFHSNHRRYTYRIQALNAKGWRSEFSDPVSVVLTVNPPSKD